MRGFLVKLKLKNIDNNQYIWIKGSDNKDNDELISEILDKFITYEISYDFNLKIHRQLQLIFFKGIIKFAIDNGYNLLTKLIFFDKEEKTLLDFDEYIKLPKKNIEKAFSIIEKKVNKYDYKL